MDDQVWAMERELREHGAKLDRDRVEKLAREAAAEFVREGEAKLAEAKLSMASDPQAPCREGEGNWATNRSHAIAQLRWARDHFEHAEKLLMRAEELRRAQEEGTR